MTYNLTEKRIRLGVISSVDKLHSAINAYTEEANMNSRPFEWIALPNPILTKVVRAKNALDKASGCRFPPVFNTPVY